MLYTLLAIQWVIAIGMQLLLVRSIRSSQIELKRFAWIIFLFLNLEWVARLIRIPDMFREYFQYFQEMNVLQLAPRFPFSLLETILFGAFYTVFAARLFQKSYSKGMKLAIQGVRVSLIFGMSAQAYSLVLESKEVLDFTNLKPPGEWIVTLGMFFVNLALSILYFKFFNRFKIKIESQSHS